MRAWVALVSVTLALLGVPGTVGAVTIGELVAVPNAFDKQSITVVGTVETSLPFGSESSFDLRDGAARVTVLSRGSAPTAGSRLSVTGTVHVFHEGDGGSEENDFPPVLVESERQSVP